VDGVQVLVLGPVEMTYRGTPVPVAGRKQRAVLATLATTPGQVVSVEALIDAVWGESPPDGVDHSLQQHVSALRKLIAGTGHPDAGAVVARRGAGYVLAADGVDSDHFEATAAAGFAASRDARTAEAIDLLTAARDQWRGPAFVDARDTPRLSAAATRLDGLRLAVLETRFDALLDSGRNGEIVGDLQAVIEEHPLHEQFRRQLMLALYRTGRQADALAAFQSTRRVLIEELGIEPSAELRAMEQAILQQSADLDGSATERRENLFVTYRTDGADGSARIEFPDGQVVMLGPAVALVGRDGDARVRFVDGRVSRRHAEIEYVDSQFRIRDLGSTNGTRVNGERVDEHRLVDGDVISLGGAEMRFRTDAN